jgi:hypothetical protein
VRSNRCTDKPQVYRRNSPEDMWGELEQSLQGKLRGNSAYLCGESWRRWVIGGAEGREAGRQGGREEHVSE